MFVDRLLVTLVHLRPGVTHNVQACSFGADRSTITRAVNAVRLRYLAEVVNHLDASGKGARPGTSSSPATGRTPSHPWWSRTAKGRTLWCSPARPASCPDITTPARVHRSAVRPPMEPKITRSCLGGCRSPRRGRRTGRRRRAGDEQRTALA
ncbi:helix-turn-helix domain-containing protein [Streptomyces canus]|uniref:helix-turn-helix domain-containing protein n=1 Tax=Streptomyces canus TaxID=58343 RepID=UPI00359490EF